MWYSHTLLDSQEYWNQYCFDILICWFYFAGSFLILVFSSFLFSWFIFASPPQIFTVSSSYRFGLCHTFPYRYCSSQICFKKNICRLFLTFSFRFNCCFRLKSLSLYCYRMNFIILLSLLLKMDFIFLFVFIPLIVTLRSDWCHSYW